MKATELLKKQHREVKALFRRAKKASAGERGDILDEIGQKLAHHMRIEEEIFYPAVHEVGTKKAEEIVPEAYEEHHVVKLVLDELPELDPGNERFEAKMTVLDELVQHHVEEEEKEMFALAEKLGDERLKELGAELEAAPVEAAGGEEEEEEGDYEDDDEDDAEDEDEDDEALEASGEEEDYEGEEDEREAADEDDYETEDAPASAIGPTARRGGSRR
jgi:hypothetical protein